MRVYKFQLSLSF